jgi:hypothetical protein
MGNKNRMERKNQKRISKGINMNQPLFWQNEISGEMKRIVLKYFSKEEKINEYELKILKEYIVQWVKWFLKNNPHTKSEHRVELANLIRNIEFAETEKEVKEIAMIMLKKHGINPF